MPFERELERKINKKTMGGSLGKPSVLFLSAGLQTSKRRRRRKSGVMAKKKGRRLDIQSKEQKNRKSDRERLCWLSGIRYSLFSN